MAGGETNLGRKGSKMEGDLLVWAVAKAREIFRENFGFETEERRARRVSVHLTLRRAERGGGRNGKGKGGNGRGRAARKRASGFRVSRSRRVGSWLAGAGFFLATPRVARVAPTCGSKSDLLPPVPVVCGPAKRFVVF